MDPEDIEFLRKFKKNERCIVPSLLKNLEERSLGCSKKNVTSKEHRELFAEELLVEKEKFDELRCEMPGMPRSTFLMVFSPDGTKVASTHGNHNIYITDIRNGKNLRTLIGHPRTPWCIAFHPTSNQIVASGCLGGQVRIWDLSGGSEVWTAKNQTVIASIAFHPIERILAIATSNEVYFWDWSKPVPFLHASTGCQKQKVRYVAFDKLGQRLITGISNSHSRWEYVGSSERSSEHPVRHLNVSSPRRPGFRRGFVPTRQNMLSSALNNSDSREAQSRVPERERNITMSYRNLVRQYGRLVQRYLQLYRPPAMIDRGTDPMENSSGPSGTNNLADMRESNNSASASAPPSSSAPLTSSAPSSSTPPSLSALQSSSDPPPSTDPTTSVAVEAQPSTSSQNNQSINTRRYVDIQHDPVNCVTPVEESRLLRKHKSDTPTESQIPQKKIKLRRDDNGDQSIPRSESPQPSTSGRSAPKRPVSKIEELSASILYSIANIPTPPAPQEHINNRTDDNDPDSEQSLSVPTDDVTPNETENQQTNTDIMELTDSITEDSVTRTDNNIRTNQEPNAHVDTLLASGTTNQDSNIQTGEHLGNAMENRVTNRREYSDAEGLIENASEFFRESITQTENPSFIERSVPGTSRDDSENSAIPNEDQIYNQMVRGLASTPEEITRSRSNEVSDATTTESYAIPEELDENLELNLDDSSLVDESVPGTSGVSEERLQTRDEPTLENMMMNMRRSAEDNLRARYMPLIQSIPENEREEIVSSAESAESSPNPAGNTSTGTTNSTICSLARRRLSDIRSAFSPTRSIPDMRRAGMSRRLETVGVPTVSNPAMDNNFARDEVINFSEFPNSENPAPERPEPFRSSLQEPFHPFNPPPNLPAINPENIGIGNMYSNIIHDLEASLNNARDIRTVDRPGEMSNMLSSFSNRLETLMNQSEGILRNLRTSVEVLPDNEPLDYGDEAPVPTANFNDSSFFVRDQRAEGAGSGRNLNSSPGYDIRQNNATSDHTYPRNSDSPSSSSNLNESMSPLMNSLHLTLSHIQSQSRLLHRQVESIERIDRAMIEVSQIQLMRLLLVELSTYVRNRSGESRSTSMSSVRQMMAGTRISDSSPGIIQNSGDSNGNTATDNQEPSTSSSSRISNQSSTSRGRGVTRKTCPPSRLNRPREAGSTGSGRNSREQVSSIDPTALPSVAPLHTFSQINMSTLLRMEGRLQSIIDDHSSRFSYLSELVFQTNNPRRLVREVGEHNLALRLRESITRTNRLIGNIFNANVVRNYRIDSSTSIRHGIERYYERTLLSLIMDGISSHLNDTIGQPLSSEIRTRMQNVLQLAMMLSDLLLLYTIISLAPTSDVNLESERRILARRIAETCSTMIRVRQYRNYSNVFVQSLRSLRLMVSSYCGSPYENPAEPNRRPENTGNAVRPVRDRYSSNTTQDTSTSSQNAERGQSNEDNRQISDVEALEMNPNNTPLINACLYLARRQMAQDQQNPNSAPSSGQAQRARNRANALINTCLYLRRRQLAQESSNSNQNSESSNSQNEDRNRRTNLTTERSGNQNPTNTNQNPETSRPSNFNPYRDMAFITSRSTDSPSTQHNSESSNQNTDQSNQNIPRQRTNMPSASEPNTSSQSVNQNADQGSRQPNRGGSESQIRDQFRSWWERTIENWATEPEGNMFGPFDRSSRQIFDMPPLPPNHSRPSTSNAFLSDAQRYWRIPSVQVNDVPLSDLAPTVENSETDNPINPTTYPRVMARLAAIRSVSVYNHPMGVLRPRLLHPLYATLNPFDADLEQREHIYDSDVISTVTPNHRIQVWDISDSVIPSISDPLKNLVVRECKIHNDASVDIACDGSILVTLLPSGGYLNITNRLGIYSLRWETLGQCLYTTSFVHNAVSVSLSPLGRHLVVGLASRRVSILPDDRWMMASIFKIEEKDTPGDHLPFVRQIDRGTDERATGHKSVNCIRWLPTSGQGLIYATNTGQLNIWT